MDELVQHAAAGQAVAFVALYRDGEWLGRASGCDGTLEVALERAVQVACTGSRGGAPTVAVVVVPHHFVTLDQRNRKRIFSDVHRGVVGVGMWCGSEPVLVSPTECLSRNRPAAGLLQELAEGRGCDAETALREGRAFSFLARQFYVELQQPGRAIEMHRGARLIVPSEVTSRRLRRFERGLSEWMLNAVHPDGRMTYLYRPSRSAEAGEVNALRVIMATICLGRIARRGLSFERDFDAREIADRNLRYTLRRFYRQEGELGLIVNGGNSYLGSAALALIAIAESPLRTELSVEERGLRATIDSLWHENGAFTTWIRPTTRKDNQNFFPGETLLAWSLLARESESDRVQLLPKILTSYRCYKRYHLGRRRPAFVPWHTQAYFQVLAMHEYPELVDWVFEMNDWLLGMQARSTQVYDDTLGQFYDPQQPFGPPHASATGVYLEGLADAFALARAVGDKRREYAYRRAILLGLRSAMQLEFVDDVSMFYAARRERVRGGLKTTAYDNTIRVDNVQHTLMAVQKLVSLLEHGDFCLSS